MSEQAPARPRRSRGEKKFPPVTSDASVVVYLPRAESELRRGLRAGDESPARGFIMYQHTDKEQSKEELARPEENSRACDCEIQISQSATRKQN